MNEVMIVEVEMRARDALTQFEKLDSQFRQTAGNNKQLYQELWRQHKKYVSDVQRENKQRAADEAWLTRELNKEVRQRSKDEQWLARELNREDEKRKKAIIQRSKDEQWLTRELEREQKQRQRDAEKAAREAERANQKPSRFGGMGGGFGGVSDKIFAAYAAVDTARGLAELADRGFRAADSLAGVHRGLETVYGSSQRAAERFKELNELAKFPGLDPEPLSRFDAIFTNLGSTAEQNNILFTGLAKSVTTFGGDVFSVSSALYQLSQGFAKNKIDAQDFKSISEQTGGTFMKTAAEVLGFTGGIEEMREAFKESGQTLQDFLMPVFVQLNEEFEGAPVGSYTNAIDNLGVAFKNLTAEVFSNASGVGKFLNILTGFIEKEQQLWNEMRTGGQAIKAVGEESEVSAAELRVLQKDLFRVSAELKRNTEKYKELKEQGIHPNTQSMQHLDRSLKNLEATHEKLSERVDTAKSKMTGMLKPVEDTDKAFKVLKQDIEAVDTRFLSFRERGSALKDAISELPPELTQVREGLSESTTWAENLQKQFDSLRGSTEKVYDVFVDLNAGLDDYIKKSEQAWQASRGSLTDISGAQSPRDFTAAQRRLYGPVDIKNNRRSYATSPMGEYRGTQSDAFLGITKKVLEFEQVTDISIDKLDEFNAQTQYTAEKLGKLRQDELAGFGAALFDIVNTIDTLTPVLEGFGLDVSSQRSHGRLAVNTTSGVGQVLSGDVFGGLSNIIKGVWEWGQPDREALSQQHEEALKRERQRVAKIQSELAAYDAQRENLFSARMDFLMHGESTFSDWTDTLKSFADHDLVRGRQVFASFSEAMDAFNNAVNQARLKLKPTEASVKYNMYQIYKDTYGQTPGTREVVTPSAENLAEYAATGGVHGQYASKEEYNAEVAASAEIDSEKLAIAETVSDQTRSKDLTNAITRLGEMAEGAAYSRAELISFLNTTIVPLLKETYADLKEQYEKAGWTVEQFEQVFGTEADYIKTESDKILSGPLAAIDQEAQKKKQIAETVSDAVRDNTLIDEIGKLGELAKTAGTTRKDLEAFITENIVPILKEMYDDLVKGLKASGWTVAQIEQVYGTEADYIANQTQSILSGPASDVDQKARETAQRAETVSDTVRGNALSAEIKALGELAKDANTTIADLQAHVDKKIVPLLKQQYDDLKEGLEAAGFTLEQIEAMHGTQDEWVEGEAEKIISGPKAFVDGRAKQNADKAATLEERTSDTERNNALRNEITLLGEFANEATTTILDLQQRVGEKIVPLLAQEYDDLVEDLLAEGFTLEQIQRMHGARIQYIIKRSNEILSSPISTVKSRNTANATRAKSVASSNASKAKSRAEAAAGRAETVSDTVRANNLSSEISALGQYAKTAGATVQEINDRVTSTIIPLLEQEYDDLVDDLKKEGYTLSQIEAMHGTKSEYVAGRRSEIEQPLVTSLNNANDARAEQLSDTVRENALSAELKSLGELANTAGTTVEQIQARVNEKIVPLLQQQYDDIVEGLEAEGFTLTEIEQMHGSKEDWVSAEAEKIAAPHAKSINDANDARAETVSDTVRENALSDELESLGELAKNANTTVEDLQKRVNEKIVPLLQQQYDDLVEGLEAEGFTLAQIEEMHGTKSAYVSDKVSEILANPTQAIKDRNTQTARILDNTEVTDAIDAIKTLTNTEGVNIADVIGEWDAKVVPELKDVYENLKKQALADHGSLERFEAEVGTLDEFLQDKKDATLQSIIDQFFGAKSSRASTGIGSQRTSLDRTETEKAWDTSFKALRQMVDDFYTAEETRLKEHSGLTGQALKDALDANEAAQKAHLLRLDNMENPFRKKRLAAEEKLQEDIDDLRDDQIENERDRLEALAELNEDHQDRLTEIERDGIRAREDLQRELNRDTQDTQAQFEQSIRELFHSEGLTNRDFQQFISGFEGDIRSRLSDTGLSRLSEIEQQRSEANRLLGSEQALAIDELGIREGRAREDLDSRTRDRRQEIIYEAEQNALALRALLEPLLGQQASPEDDPTAEVAEVAEPVVTATEAFEDIAEPTTLATDALGKIIEPTTLATQAIVDFTEPTTLATQDLTALVEATQLVTPAFIELSTASDNAATSLSQLPSVIASIAREEVRVALGGIRSQRSQGGSLGIAAFRDQVVRLQSDGLSL